MDKIIENEDKFEEIIDVTGIKLTPSENGTKCLGNGEHFGENGERIECCCDECDYMMCCFPYKKTQ